MRELLVRPLPFTPEGEHELGVEVAIMDGWRREILLEMEDARGHTSLVLRRELDAIERQIDRLRCALAMAVRVAHPNLMVGVGSEVTIADEDGERKVTIVGPIAANPGRGCISYESPLGRALLGAERGDAVEVRSGGGRRWIKVVETRQGRPTGTPPVTPGRYLLATAS